MTAAQFKAEFPEFSQIPDAVLTPKITDASKALNAGIWGADLSEGVKLLTADLAARSPYARTLQLVRGDGTTLYSERLRFLRRKVTMGRRTF